MVRRFALAAALLCTGAAAHASVTVLTVGKRAVFRTDSALITFGRDRAFAVLADPTCAGGIASTLQIASYPEATARVAASAAVPLDCARWRRDGARYVYEDPSGSALGARRIVYASGRLVMKLSGGTYAMPPAPAGYAEVWLSFGAQRLLGRFHVFRKNTARLMVTRKPSLLAADGEAAFWDVLHGGDASEARQQEALRLLARGSKRDPKDGRSWFLLGMMHLYRFGAGIGGFDAVPAAAKAELAQADAAFEKALPLLWDGTHGDSRVPGFAAAAKFTRGIVEQDTALAAEGMADLEAAIAVNAFFNVFDLIPVVQALPRTDPRFAAAVEQVVAYLDDPDTLACVGTQPELCANDGLALRNVSGSLLLFGDVYAKQGNLERAQFWYGLARAVTGPGYAFQDLLDDRVANAPARVAAYLDGDPANDPPVVGLGRENCATCHNR